MKALLMRNWSLRVKLAVLLLVASVLPLAIAAYADIRETRAQLVASIGSVLAARADQLVREFDGAHAGYQGAGDRLSRLPDIVAYCAGDKAARAALEARVQGILAVGRASDRHIRSVALIDGDGRVVVATDSATVGLDLSSRPTFRAAMEGGPVVNGVYVTGPKTGSQPSVAYLTPVRGAQGGVRCVTSLAVHADKFWEPLERSGGLAGPGSFAVVLDQAGVRIAHTSLDANVYHPAGPLPRPVIEEYTAAGRFGPDTRQLLEDVRAFPEIFDRARAATPDPAPFRGVASYSGQVNYGVGRRLQRIGWTVFYMEPEENLVAQLDAVTRERALFSLVFITIAALFGIALARGILGQVGALAHATGRLAAGDSAVRIKDTAKDELGALGAGFNAMADRLASQSAALQQANAELETRVRERTGLLNAVVDHSPASIVLKDLQGRFLLVNDHAARTLRQPKEQLIGKTAAEVFGEEAARRMAQGDRDVIAADAPVTEEVLAAEPDGIHTYLSVKFPVRDAEGAIHGIGAISPDITDRKAAEYRLLAQLERMNLLDQITIAVGERQDLASIHQVVVRSLEDQMQVDFCCILGHDPGDDVLVVARVGAGTEALAAQLMQPAPARIPVDANGLARCMRGELVYEPDIEGSAFPFGAQLARAGLRSLVLAPLTAESRVVGVLLVARRPAQAFTSTDCEFLRQLSGHVALAGRQALLTGALKLANDELRQSQQRVLQQERLSALGQMASGIAHDINNAISPAGLYVEALLEREPGLSARARGQLEIISRAIDDVAATVARMREFYRDRAPQAELLPVDLDVLVEQVLELTRARWSDMPQQRGVQVTLARELAPGLPRVMGIESEIREALINLVFNAVDAMPQGGKLTVRTRLAGAGDRVELEVADTGVGMDEATRLSCLEPFFTTKGERGTGLGLAMVYGIAQRHDASLDIDSAPGRGTCMRLGFAVPPETPASTESFQPQAMPAPLRILIVDDDPLLRQSLTDALDTDGHLVTAADGGKAGIAQFLLRLGLPSQFEVVITDLGMPQVDGRQVAQAVKRASAVPVIMLTGWGQRLADDGEMPGEVDVLLGKPPKLRELRAALARIGACAPGKKA